MEMMLSKFIFSLPLVLKTWWDDAGNNLHDLCTCTCYGRFISHISSHFVWSHVIWIECTVTDCSRGKLGHALWSNPFHVAARALGTDEMRSDTVTWYLIWTIITILATNFHAHLGQPDAFFAPSAHYYLDVLPGKTNHKTENYKKTTTTTTLHPLTAFCLELPRWAHTNLDLLEQQTMSGNGISWAKCKSAPRSDR